MLLPIIATAIAGVIAFHLVRKTFDLLADILLAAREPRTLAEAEDELWRKVQHLENCLRKGVTKR